MRFDAKMTSERGSSWDYYLLSSEFGVRRKITDKPERRVYNDNTYIKEEEELEKEIKHIVKEDNRI